LSGPDVAGSAPIKANRDRATHLLDKPAPVLQRLGEGGLTLNSP
jgi:hypothetical protein